MRKLSSLLIALMACITFANAEVHNGTCGDNLTWSLVDSVLTIDGSGEMWVYNSWSEPDTIPWDQQGFHTLIVSKDVTFISESAFDQSANLRTIYWNVREYGREYMGDQPKYPYLEHIIFGEEVETIPALIGYRCSNLKEINMPSSVKTIREYAFSECTGLISISFPESLTHIEHDAFSGCSGLTSITIPSGVKEIDYRAFAHCSSLASIEIPNSVMEIEDEAFYGCINLTSIAWNMRNCHNAYLSSEKPLELSLGEDVESFGGYCTGLVSITSRAINPPSLDEYVFQDVDKSIPVYVSGGSISDYQKANVWKDFKNILPICETIETEETRYLCSGTTLMWYGMSYSGSGDYTQTLMTIHGCDSIVTLHLIELPLLTGDTTAFITKGSSFIWHGVSFTAENTPATWRYVSRNTPECDSIVTLHIIEIEDPAPCLKASGTCGAEGDNLTWTLSCDSVLTISGTGAMYEYYWNTPWMEYKDEVRYVIVEEGVTTIGATAFRDFIHLRQCSLPSTLISIGEEAFCFCFQLMSVDIPQSCTTISGWGAFNLVPNVNIQDESIAKNCAARSINGYVEGYFVYADKSKRSLRACSSIAKGYVALDDAIERIEYMAFAQCEEITNLQFGSHLQYIGEWSLNGCIGLEGLRFQEGLKEIASNAFGNCFGLQYVYLPNSLTTLGDFAIGNCPVLRTIHLGDSLRNVGSQIFDSCQGIDTIYATMTTPPVLDNTAFAASNLPGITCYVPKASLSLYQQAPVWSSMNLKAIGSFDPEPCLIASGTCGDNLTWELSCDSVLTISGSGAMTSAPWIKSYKTAIKNAIIEDGVTNIYGYAFYYCSNLESVTIGNGVTQIEEYAFYKCTALESVQLPKNIQSIGNYAYAYCSSLTSIALPNSVTTMGDEVFCMCTSLASASLSENLTKISMGTFDGCTALSSIIVPEGVKTIEARAFYQCKSLVSIEIPSTVTFIDGVAFSLPISFETALKTFTCHAIVPPSLGNNVFEYLEPGANLIRLYVPGASLEAYKAADQWKEFEIILPIPGTEPCESDNTIRTISACSGYWFNDEWLEQSGIYHDTLLNHLGCDSIIELHLTIHSSYGGGVPSDLIDTITIVKGDPVIISDGITIYPTETGYQNDTMRTIYGCDSIVTHYIIVTEPTCLLGAGTCGDNLTWELSCDSVLTISGTGTMTNYHTALNRSPWDGDAKIKEVIFSDGVTTVGDYAFYNCDKLTSVTLPNSITYIGTVAFEYCGNLTEIEIPNSVTTISSNALAGCGFSTIFIPSSVTTIGGAALNGSNVQSINVAEDNPNYCSVDGVLFDKNKTILIKYPDGKQGACIIPSTVTSIGYLGLASGISSITCEALVPPSLEKGALVNVDKAIPLYVHYESIEVYKATAGWKDFTNIQPIEGTFPVTFLDYNGEVLSEQNVAYNQAAAAPEVPAREGYTFSGWSTDIEHIVARTFAIAIYDKIGGTLTYLSEEGDVIATENVDLHLPAAPIIAGKSFKGWLTESADSENGIVLRATYTFDNPTTHDDVTITPSSNSAYVIFPFITGALTYQLVIRDLFGNVVCKIMFSATGHLLGIAFAPSRNRESQQATQTTGFNFTVEGLDANTTYEYEFVANDDTDEVIETLSGSFTTKAEVPTDNEQVNSPSAVRKYLEDGHMMIDANSHIFDTQGKIIK